MSKKVLDCTWEELSGMSIDGYFRLVHEELKELKQKLEQQLEDEEIKEPLKIEFEVNGFTVDYIDGDKDVICFIVRPLPEQFVNEGHKKRFKVQMTEVQDEKV